MKRSILLIILLTTFSIISGQDVIEKKYYKSEKGWKRVSEKKAKVVEYTIKDNDGTIRYEMRRIENDEIIRLRSYKNNIQVGKWLDKVGSERDYDFELQYREEKYDSIRYFDFIDNTIKGEIEGDFKPPVFTQYDNNFRMYIASNLDYPMYAAENGIQGKVFFQVIISETGAITEISISKGVHETLDKEAMRVLRESPKWIPAEINGKPVRVCFTIPISFVLQM